MFFLSLDVTVHLGQHRLTYRERAVSFLPCESRGVFERSRDPAGRVRLQLPDELRNRLVLPKFCQDVNVVGRPIDDHRDSIFIANRAAEVLMRPRAYFRRQPGLAPLCRKDDVIEQIAIGGTHRTRISVAPLQGLCCFRMIHPEFRYAPLRALISTHPPGAIAPWWRMAIVRSLPSAPEARRNTARSGAQQNSRESIHQTLQPCQGVTELESRQKVTNADYIFAKMTTNLK